MKSSSFFQRKRSTDRLNTTSNFRSGYVSGNISMNTTRNRSFEKKKVLAFDITDMN
jgi:hypothetical protein